MKGIYAIFLSLVVTAFTACQEQKEFEISKQEEAEMLHRSVHKLTEVIVHDIFSPPVASRIYAYTSIASYEAMVPSDVEYKTLAGQLNELHTVPQPKRDEDIYFPLASLNAYLIVGKALVFSEDRIESYRISLIKSLEQKGLSDEVKMASLEFGEQVAQHILDWAEKDNYKETRTYTKYEIKDDPSRWRPTPPAYIEGIEPHWNDIRTFVLDSADQYVPKPPKQYNMDESAPFYQEVKEVYEVGKDIKEEHLEIAKFWDCNPYVMNVKGHVMFATKKITPGGHWVGITTIACRETEADIMQSTEAYALTSIALADGFISCWDEKYRSNLVRPETVINKNIDPDWKPALQTPPFPEYTSGHSVISTSAAVTLTNIFGEPFHFLDTTENEYGLPARSFNSFMEASQEAAISRLYGGIHYRMACEVGVEQGKKVGRFVVQNLETRNEELAEN